MDLLDVDRYGLDEIDQKIILVDIDPEIASEVIGTSGSCLVILKKNVWMIGILIFLPLTMMEREFHWAWICTGINAFKMALFYSN